MVEARSSSLMCTPGRASKDAITSWSRKQQACSTTCRSRSEISGAAAPSTRPPAYDFPTKFTYYLVYPEALSNEPKIDSFRQWLFEEAADWLASPLGRVADRALVAEAGAMSMPTAV
jgi:hypothetical protein